MTTHTAKQTAANNAFLAASKVLFNLPTYKAISAAMNAGGDAAGRAEAAKHYRGDVETDVASILASRAARAKV